MVKIDIRKISEVNVAVTVFSESTHFCFCTTFLILSTFLADIRLKVTPTITPTYKKLLLILIGLTGCLVKEEKHLFFQMEIFHTSSAFSLLFSLSS